MSNNTEPANEPNATGATLRADERPVARALRDNTRIVPDFPSPGIVFEDLTPVLADPESFRLIVHDLCDHVRTLNVDLIGGLDARGFLLGSAVAYELGIGILAVRKGGKLPPPVYRREYELEYGSAALEVPAEGIPLQGKRIVLIDDVLATGGTLEASRELLEQAGAHVCGLAVVLEVEALAGRDRLQSLPLYVVASGESYGFPDDGNSAVPETSDAPQRG